MKRRVFRALPVLVALSAPASAGDSGTSEKDYYRLSGIPVPEEVVLECGGLEMMDDGRLAVATRWGEVWMVENALETPPSRAGYTLWASGLHEVLGLARRDGWLYATQRGEVTRMKDADGDGRADVFETFCDGWGLSGDYHEYAFGSKFDSRGDLWVVLCLTGSFSSKVPFRGWCVRIDPTGRMIPTASGIRSPGGIGANAAGDMFCTDNQGPWNGTCALKHLQPGGFLGHPAGNRWYELAPDLEVPETPASDSRMHVEADRIPQLVPPAVLFPYQKMGQSASGVACDTTGGRFGPFAKQLFVADQTHSTVMRVFLEKVEGVYQGACFPFRRGFGSGNVPLLFTSGGALFVGGTQRGWGSRGGRKFALERLDWTGRTPFEVLEMRATPRGFELRFTLPVDAESAGTPESYRLSTYTYIYRSSYGSPEVDHTAPDIIGAEVSDERLSVHLEVDGLRRGHVHELHLDGVSSGTGAPLLHPVAYYTLNRIPGGGVERAGR